jgi:rhodanese-related sulfurtransferase
MFLRTLTFTLAALTSLAASPANAQFSFFRSGPEIEEISAKDLYQNLLEHSQNVEKARISNNQPPRPSFIVVDVRDPREYNVSLIPGAITKEQYEKNKAQFAHATIIPYCTVGGRSAQYSRELAAQGVKVINFKESIIGWCEAKLPLVTLDGKSTQRVHTYNSRNRVPSDYQPVY